MRERTLRTLVLNGENWTWSLTWWVPTPWKVHKKSLTCVFWECNLLNYIGYIKISKKCPPKILPGGFQLPEIDAQFHPFWSKYQNGKMFYICSRTRVSTWFFSSPVVPWHAQFHPFWSWDQEDTMFLHMIGALWTMLSTGLFSSPVVPGTLNISLLVLGPGWHDGFTCDRCALD